MKELRDYSGDFNSDLKLSDFSAAALANLLSLYARMYMALDGFWYLSARERFGNEPALACDMQTWDSVSKYEMAKITNQLNIQGNNVMAFMKAIQMTPWFLASQGRIEAKNHDNAILTVTYCPMLEAVEKEGKGREYELCNVVSPKIFRDYASFFNPDIEIKCLKAPPRDKKDKICCQWEFTLCNTASS